MNGKLANLESNDLDFSEVRNIILPANNIYDIPDLSSDFCADFFEGPSYAWRGPNAAIAKKARLWHFYTNDMHFSSLKKRHALPLQTIAPALVEPNFSIDGDSVFCVAVTAIYWKRFLARFWQSYGRYIYVDLNVPEKYQELNLIGVPKGWRAYATRGVAGRCNVKPIETILSEEKELAMNHAESKDILFVVFAGGKAAREWCRENAAHHVDDYRGDR